MREAGFVPDWNRPNFDYNFLIFGGGEEARFQTWWTTQFFNL